MKHITDEVIPPLNLHEFFQVDIPKVFIEQIDPALVGDGLSNEVVNSMTLKFEASGKLAEDPYHLLKNEFSRFN